MRYWQPLGAKTTVTRCQPHPENDRQRSVHNDLVMHIGWSQHRTDTWAHNTTIDCLAKQQYNLSEDSHGFQHNWYHRLQNMLKPIIGCWIPNFDDTLLLICKMKSLLWIDGLTRYATHWSPTQFRQVGIFPLNCTQVDRFCALTTQTGNLATVWFWTQVWTRCEAPELFLTLSTYLPPCWFSTSTDALQMATINVSKSSSAYPLSSKWAIPMSLSHGSPRQPSILTFWLILHIGHNSKVIYA